MKDIEDEIECNSVHLQGNPTKQIQRYTQMQQVNDLTVAGKWFNINQTDFCKGCKCAVELISKEVYYFHQLKHLGGMWCGSQEPYHIPFPDWEMTK